MILFQSDYTEGACPEILNRLVETNMEQTPGYSEDEHCMRAAQLIQKECNAPEAKVHFLVGGTQTNMTVIGAALRPYQGVLSAQTGHIHVHETGAVESLGYKILALPEVDGKIKAEQVDEACTLHKNDGAFEHMVQPKMVYISQPTELGTLYTKQELMDLRSVCDKHDLYLFVDGARLGYGLAAKGNDVTMEDLAKLTDVFYIGGTKVGAMFGEAVVITNPALKRDFRYMIKQRGGMLAKGRLLGLQFEALFTEGLYLKIGEEAVRKALRLREIFEENGFPAAMDSPTNQQFFVLPNSVIDRLKENASFELWGPRGETETTVRFVTGWSTTDEDIETLKRLISGC